MAQQQFQISSIFYTPSPNNRDEYIDLTPEGNIVEGNDPGWANKGYVFTTEEAFTIYGAEWWIYLPEDGFIRTTIYNENEDILVNSYSVQEVKELLKEKKIINGVTLLALQWFFLEYYKD